MNRLDKQCRGRKIPAKDTLKVILTEKDVPGAKRPCKTGEQCTVVQLKYGVFAHVTFQDLGRENIAARSVTRPKMFHSERTELCRDPGKVSSWCLLGYKVWCANNYPALISVRLTILKRAVSEDVLIGRGEWSTRLEKVWLKKIIIERFSLECRQTKTKVRLSLKPITKGTDN